MFVHHPNVTADHTDPLLSGSKKNRLERDELTAEPLQPCVLKADVAWSVSGSGTSNLRFIEVSKSLLCLHQPHVKDHEYQPTGQFWLP